MTSGAEFILAGLALCYAKGHRDNWAGKIKKEIIVAAKMEAEKVSAQVDLFFHTPQRVHGDVVSNFSEFATTSENYVKEVMAGANDSTSKPCVMPQPV